MTNVTLYAPQAGGTVLTPSGSYAVAADGSVSVPADDILPLLKSGFQIHDVDGSAAVARALLKIVTDRVLTTVGLAIGTTVTIAFGAFEYMIGAASGTVNTFKHKAAVTALSFGALGTIPASVWGIILLQIDASGTVTFKSGAANYAAGYASEALAIAALPSPDSAKAAMGYVTILASASTWIAATDALAGGTGGNPATTTNYYNAGVGF